ncbi:DNA polymerase I [Dissulfuribacter thermophilus]|uniref:DNA polymerase I n=1 Tax=Dissulfuribacter thermophilus TaxID=1156395 RepID=A0A1B9F893_9BACT|nr:DNA polymerase I [Dissulfuribacter thermophilus]OCC16074.1 DNA polymerase I [Dissulfuribacter thermophilus]
MKKGPEELFIIDGSSYLYRGYFAIRQNLTTSSGFPTKAIFNVTNMILKVLREKDPGYCVVVWDAKGPNFRHELYPQYKANRPPMPEDLVIQVPYVKEIVEALGIPQIEIEKVEADDSIATICKGLKGVKKVIVSGDKDLVQLVDDECVIWDPMKDDWIDKKAVLERFGVEPEKLLDVQTLSGDTADNIPGVKGIGPKKALKLIQDFGSVEELLQRIDELPKGKLKDNLKLEQENIPVYKALVGLKTDVPIDLDLKKFERRPWDIDRLKELFEKFEFQKFLNDLIPKKKIEYDDYELALDHSKLDEIKELIQRAKEVVIDTETDSENPIGARLIGISIAISPPKAYYIPIAHKEETRNLSLETVKSVLGPIFKDENIKKIGQNIKFDIIVLRSSGFQVHGVYGDTMVASYLLDPSRRQHNLETLAKEYLGHQMISFKELMRGRKFKDFSEVSIEEAMRYSCEDVHVTFLLKDILFKRLQDAGLMELFHKVEIPLINVLAHMEQVGILIDQKGAKELSKEFDSKISELEKKIHDLAGIKFNINSHQQLQKVLFERLGLTSKKKTKKKTGYSTDTEVLQELREEHPICDLLLEYRNLSKLKSTYLDGLLKMINPRTNRIHTSYNQTVTATGRLSSSNPNLQNIPIRTEDGLRIRSLFIADEGKLFLSSDYSQIDLRVLAHYSKDKALIEAFLKGEDIHTKTASEIFDVHPAFVTPEMRRMAKTVNFGIIYGMSPYGLSKELGIDRSKAKTFIQKYFEKYPGVKQYMDKAIETARKQGFVTTILDRRRFIPEINSPLKHVREFAERTAINTPIQGSAADIIKLAMIRAHEFIEKRQLRARLILQVHDELVFEVPEDEIEILKEEVKKIMEGAVKLDVPLIANIGIGKNWAEAKA